MIEREAKPDDARPLSGVNQDLGLGGRFAESTTVRLLKQDGTFNARRLGRGRWHSVNLYHTLIELSPFQLIGLSILAYLALNLCFAALYFACGKEAISSQDDSQMGRFESCFYFSVQTIGTIGYGRMVPVSRAANLLVAVEALVGLIGFAVLSALIYARFTRPRSALVFSKKAVIAPYRGGWALMLRVANGRMSDVSQVRATVTISRWAMEDGARKRRFDVLELERPWIVFMPLHWVIVHAINEQSPLQGLTREEFVESEPEVFVLVSADEETFAMTVHARTSYRREEIAWGEKFEDMYVGGNEQEVVVDLGRIDATVSVETVSVKKPGHL